MSRVRLCELAKKEVINCCDCKKLGYIDDLIIDDCKGCIEALVVPEGGKWCNFFGDGTEYIIPFSCIKRIGPDLILVEIQKKIGEMCLTSYFEKDILYLNCYAFGRSCPCRFCRYQSMSREVAVAGFSA